MKACYPVTDVTAPHALTSLADKVRRLLPSHRHPERFHIDKCEIEAELRRLAKGGARG